MAAQENTAINNLLHLVAAQRVGFERVREEDRAAPPPPAPRAPAPRRVAAPPPVQPVRPIFPQDDDDDAATQFVDRDDQATNLVDRDEASTHLVERVDDNASTHFVERYHGRVPEATPRGAWSPADMRSTAERMVDVVALRAVSRTAPPRAGDIPSLRRPDATPPHAWSPAERSGALRTMIPAASVGGPVPGSSRAHALEAPALSSVVAVHAYQHAYAPPQPPPPQAPLGAELRHTLRKLAAPITFVALFAISLSTYLAFAGGGDSVASAAAAPAPAPAPTPAPAPAVKPPPPPAPEPTKQVEADAERPAYVAADRTGEEVPAVEPAAEDVEEIEMDAVGIERPRPAKRERTAVRPRIDEPKKEPPPKKEVKKDTKAPKIEEGALPDNIANKTSTEMGTILVTSNIPALIYLDGRNTRMMTPKQFTVPAGPHKITLLEPESKKARTQDLKVLPGKTASVDKQF